MSSVLDHGHLSMALSSQLDFVSLEIRHGQDEWLNVSAISPISHHHQTNILCSPFNRQGTRSMRLSDLSKVTLLIGYRPWQES